MPFTTLICAENVRIFARAVSNPGPPDYSFDGINTTPFTTLLSAHSAHMRTLLTHSARTLRTLRTLLT